MNILAALTIAVITTVTMPLKQTAPTLTGPSVDKQAYALTNPLPYSIEADITCGSEYAVAIVHIGPNDVRLLHFQDAAGVSLHVCWIDRWKKERQ